MSALVGEFSRFANLFPEPILLVSSSGHLCAANAGAQRALLQDAELTSERRILGFVDDDEQKVLDYLRACSRSAEPLPGLLTFRTASAVPVAYRCLGSAFQSRDDQQRPLIVLRLAPKDASSNRFVGLNQQIEQLRREVRRRLEAEQTAREQRELLQVTLASIGDAVVATDTEGRVTFMNAVAEAHMGCKRADSLGLPLDEIFVIGNELTGERLENPVLKVLRTGRTVAFPNHTVLVRADGAQLPIDDAVAPIRDERGRMLGAVLVFREISESRKLQHELMCQAEALKEADRRKDQFLAVLAHELRNPLAPLRNGLQIARMKAPTDEILMRAVAMMERQLVHLVRLVDDLMDVSRVSRGVIELRRAPVLITDVLARSVEAVRADMETRGHTLHVDVPSQTIGLNGDEDRLTQVFSNLLANSSKYSPDGGFIRLGVNRQGAEVVIEVSDHGVGIPTDQLEHVFDMFSQVRAHQGRAEGGLGIGLSLVRTLVEMHGGCVVARSEGPGTGSTFTVRLPVLPASENPLPAPLVQSHRAEQRLRILVADDNEDSAGSLRLLLETSGHEVYIARDGVEAVQQAEHLRPAIIFMDVGMPGMDGIEATRRIRDRPYGKDIMIVALTGWGQPQDRERTKVAGADRHVVKPISPEDLAAALSLALR